MVEIHLTEDSVVHLGPHKLRIAELNLDASSVPRPPVDRSHGYTAEMAEQDILRVAAIIARSETQAEIEEARPAAALLLSKLHGWKMGAPPESPGHAYARRVFGK